MAPYIVMSVQKKISFVLRFINIISIKNWVARSRNGCTLLWSLLLLNRIKNIYVGAVEVIIHAAMSDTLPIGPNVAIHGNYGPHVICSLFQVSNVIFFGLKIMKKWSNKNVTL